MSGCVHIYCGDGKGKTTAAVGLAVRAAGRGRRVLMARFLKTDDSGEVLALEHVPEINVLPCEKIFGFYYQMTEKQKAEAGEYYSDLFRLASGQAVKGRYDMLVLDEIMAACNYGLVKEADVETFLRNRPEEMEVVMTGRGPSDRLLVLADYVSEIRMVRHPYEQGVAAREGIEF